MNPRIFILLLLVVGGLWASDSLKMKRIPPKSPTDALQSFRTQNGFRMELVAHEPQVVDPVAACYDENGRLFVIEMRDYPTPHQPGQPALGRVRLLEDKDGNGHYETAHIFADGLVWPTGIACWKGGIYVIAAPDIWYFKDADGDGRAEIREKKYSGFTVYNVQAMANNLRWGVDNRIYGVTAGNGGAIRRADQPNATPMSVAGRDFCFDPRSGSFEVISGTAQFGLAFDDWYERFLCANRLIAGHVVMPADALARNPQALIPRVVQDCAAEGENVPIDMFQISPPEEWREVRTKRYLQEKQNLPPSEMNATGLYTSGTGITIYRGSAYPPEYRGQMFVGNVAGNLIHRRRFVANGATYRVERVDAKREFLASTDNWFRPVNFLNAPDGTLHILDMYRENVEHPWSIPDDIKTQLDLESGRDRGRIYRLAPPDYQRPASPQLGTSSSDELVTLLAHPNAWHRETAQRLLIEREDQRVVDKLRELSQSSPNPLGRLHAIWTLEGLGALQAQDIERALKSEVAGLRIHGLRLAGTRIGNHPELTALILSLSQDNDPRVRYHTALTLGLIHDERAIAALAEIARRSPDEVWTNLAILTACADRADRLLERLDAKSPALAVSLTTLIGSRNRPDEVKRALRIIEAHERSPALMIGLGEGLLRNGKTLRELADSSTDFRDRLNILLTTARQQGMDSTLPPAGRAAAILLLAHARFEDAKAIFTSTLDLQQSREVQLATLRAMRSHTDPAVATLIIERLGILTPVVRADALTTLLSRSVWANSLLDAIEAKRVPLTVIDSPRRAILLQSSDATLKAKATKLLGNSTSSTRAEIVARYRDAITTPGDATKGKAIFMRECAACHIAGNVGNLVGPVMAAVGNRQSDALLVNILDPNREVDPRYLTTSISTRDGRLLSGVVATETATSITLRRADGVNDTVLRSQIEELVSTGQSLMPEGLEQRISIREMADLLAFIAEAR